MQLKEALTMFYLSILSHVGAGDDAHMTVDSEHNGFMSTAQNDKLIEASGKRTHLDAGADAFTLPPGRYEGAGIVNTPNQGLIEIDVSIGDGGRKQITLWESFSGRLWSYTWHSTGSILNFGWMVIPRKKILWSGSAFEVDTVLTLGDSLALFTYLNIEFDNSSGARIIAKIPTRGGNVELKNQAKGTATPIITFYEIGIWKQDDTHMLIKTNQKSYISGSNGLVNSTDGLGKVLKIEGVIE